MFPIGRLLKSEFSPVDFAILHRVDIFLSCQCGDEFLLNIVGVCLSRRSLPIVLEALFTVNRQRAIVIFGRVFIAYELPRGCEVAFAQTTHPRLFGYGCIRLVAQDLSMQCIIHTNNLLLPFAQQGQVRATRRSPIGCHWARMVSRFWVVEVV